MITLHQFDRSPYGWKVRIVLNEKGIPCDLVVPANKNEDPAFAKLNPFKLTPVLQLEDGRTVWESTVVNEYLEEAYPQKPMLPKDPWERARVRMIEDASDQYLAPAGRAVVLGRFEYAPPHLVRRADANVDKAALEEARRKLAEQRARFETALGAGPWFGGTLFSLADAALVPLLSGNLRTVGEFPAEKFPGLAAWIGRALERPSVRDAAPKQPLTIKEG
jgi:glutathione S-transferase